MANRADGTDGSGAPRLGKSQVSGKSEGFGKTASRSMPQGGKTISGKADPSFGDKKARNTGGNANGNSESRSQINRGGWGSK